MMWPKPTLLSKDRDVGQEVIVKTKHYRLCWGLRGHQIHRGFLLTHRSRAWERTPWWGLRTMNVGGWAETPASFSPLLPLHNGYRCLHTSRVCPGGSTWAEVWWQKVAFLNLFLVTNHKPHQGPLFPPPFPLGISPTFSFLPHFCLPNTESQSLCFCTFLSGGGGQGRASQVVLMVKNLPAYAGDTRDEGSMPGLGRSAGTGNGNPLQYSCLENSMDRGAWWATVDGVTHTERLSTHTTLWGQGTYLHLWVLNNLPQGCVAFKCAAYQLCLKLLLGKA